MFLGLTGTRYPLFCAKNFANSLGFESTPVDDILLFNIAFGRTVQDISLNAVANLGYAEVIFHSPVFLPFSKKPVICLLFSKLEIVNAFLVKFISTGLGFVAEY